MFFKKLFSSQQPQKQQAEPKVSQKYEMLDVTIAGSQGKPMSDPRYYFQYEQDNKKKLVRDIVDYLDPNYYAIRKHKEKEENRQSFIKIQAAKEAKEAKQKASQLKQAKQYSFIQAPSIIQRYPLSLGGKRETISRNAIRGGGGGGDDPDIPKKSTLQQQPQQKQKKSINTFKESQQLVKDYYQRIAKDKLSLMKEQIEQKQKQYDRQRKKLGLGKPNFFSRIGQKTGQGVSSLTQFVKGLKMGIKAAQQKVNEQIQSRVSIKQKQQALQQIKQQSIEQIKKFQQSITQKQNQIISEIDKKHQKYIKQIQQRKQEQFLQQMKQLVQRYQIDLQEKKEKQMNVIKKAVIQQINIFKGQIALFKAAQLEKIKRQMNLQHKKNIQRMKNQYTIQIQNTRYKYKKQLSYLARTYRQTETNTQGPQRIAQDQQNYIQITGGGGSNPINPIVITIIGNQLLTVNQKLQQPSLYYIGLAIKTRTSFYYTRNYVKIYQSQYFKLPQYFQYLQGRPAGTIYLQKRTLWMKKDIYKGITYYSLRQLKWSGFDLPMPTRRGFNLRVDQMQALIKHIQKTATQRQIS